MPDTLVSPPLVSAGSIRGIMLCCPRCRDIMQPTSDQHQQAYICRSCQFPMVLRDGVWLSLPIERATYFSRFITDYETIRAAEGRGSRSADYYLSLPYTDLTGNNTAQWRIRAATFSFLKKNILPSLQQDLRPPIRILDIGAGNGWLSYRLAQLNLTPVAVDLLVNSQDGLGASVNYDRHLDEPFLRFQAESAKLPFGDAQFDAVIFNASFHYAESYEKCTREALRCLKQHGMLIIADSPWYSRHASGEQMLVERRTYFLNRFGTLSNSIPSLEFLTDERLAALKQIFGIKWQVHTPFYGMKWSLRPWIARLRNKREPSLFRIYTARKTA